MEQVQGKKAGSTLLILTVVLLPSLLGLSFKHDNSLSDLQNTKAFAYSMT